MFNKGLAVLLISATASASAPAAAPHWTSGTGAPSFAHQGFTGHKLFPVDSTSSSRRDRIPGEKVGAGIVKSSAGTFSMGDMAAMGVKAGGGFMEDMILGAALFLQATQSPLDRQIQAIVSRNFESYWD